MAWRLHLSNQAVQRLDIFSGRPALLAAWIRRDRVAYFDLASGSALAEQTLPPAQVDDRRSDAWQAYVAELVAPNRTYLPVVRTPHAAIFTTEDGRVRLYHTQGNDLYVQADGKESKLHVIDSAPFVLIEFDSMLGLTVTLDERGKLNVYRQSIRVGHFDLGIALQPDLQPGLAVSRGGSAIFVSDGQRIVLTGTSGKIRGELDVHYFIGKLICSPNGRLLATSDAETGVIRIYSGIDLSPMYQRFAIDLLAEATQVQLMADLPPVQVAPRALVMDDSGVLAFAMSGVICVTDTTFMNTLPQPPSGQPIS